MNATSVAKRYLLLSLLCIFSCCAGAENPHHSLLRSKLKELTQKSERLDIIIITLGDIGRQLHNKQGTSDTLNGSKAALLAELKTITSPNPITQQSAITDHERFCFVPEVRKRKKRVKKICTTAGLLYCNSTFCWQNNPCQIHFFKG